MDNKTVARQILNFRQGNTLQRVSKTLPFFLFTQNFFSGQHFGNTFTTACKANRINSYVLYQYFFSRKFSPPPSNISLVL